MTAEHTRLYALGAAGFKISPPMRPLPTLQLHPSDSIRSFTLITQAGLFSHLSLRHPSVPPSSSSLPFSVSYPPPLFFRHGLVPFVSLSRSMPSFTSSSTLSSLVRLVALVATLSPVLIGLVEAHGYVSSPGSRAYMCKQGQVHGCGEIQYEPQSVEAPKGLPFARSGGSKLCSAGLPQFAELDRQGASVWPTTKAREVNSFTWTFTAQHATTDFRYFITKPSWDAGSADGLSASDLESEPFLVVPMNGRAPPQTMNHDLAKNMPQRKGHHVVYAVWTVDNTANAFYQCIDLDFGGGSSAASTSSGGNTGSAPSPSSSAASSGSSNSSADTTSSTGYSNSSSSGSTSTSTSTTSGGAGTANTPHKNHAANPAACRMKRRRRSAPASKLAARADYHRGKMQLQRKRQS